MWGLRYFVDKSAMSQLSEPLPAATVIAIDWTTFHLSQDTPTVANCVPAVALGNGIPVLKIHRDIMSCRKTPLRRC